MKYLHTQRTIAELKKRKTTLRFENTQRWNKFAVRSSDGKAGISQDLFGFCDILVLDIEKGFIAVQSTGKDYSGHYKKMTVDCKAACLDWLRAGKGRSAIELWSWQKKKLKRGGKAFRYEPKVKNMALEDFLPPWHGGLLSDGSKS